MIEMLPDPDSPRALPLPDDERMWVEEPASTWPDQDEVARWRDALDDAALRELDERGVGESCALTVAGGGSLRAHFGPVTIPVAGPDAEVSDPAGLFGVIDRWVAFERPDGPGAVLDRDRQFRTDHLAHLMSNRVLWDQAAQLVFRDVRSTTALDWSWDVVIHESAADFLGYGGSGLPWMEFQMTTVGRGIGSAANLEAAVDEIADIVQDEVVEESMRAWPPCPRHAHPLKSSSADWTCPGDGKKVAAVGALAAPEG